MSSEATAIQARDLGKVYRIYPTPHHRLLQGLLRRPMHEEFWALRGASFEVARGEAVGVIGRNGSGKSTLLQLVAGILPPSEGELAVDGRVAALLELGAGFNPEFTGRENVGLNASLLGLSPDELAEEMPRIIAFAEIGQHLDQPVKTYSSGMFVRLAFAVAVHTRPEILIVDESLAVGDVYFQAKCQRRIEELRGQGCTFLLVTHSTDVLTRMCDRGIVLERGRIAFDGRVRDAVETYLGLVFGSRTRSEVQGADSQPRLEATKAEDDGTQDAKRWLAGQQGDLLHTRAGYLPSEIRIGRGQARVVDFAFEGRRGAAPVFDSGSDVGLHVRYSFEHAMGQLVFGFQVRAADGTLVYSTNSFFLENRTWSVGAPGEHTVNFSFRLPLLPGIYRISLGVSRFDRGGTEIAALDRRMDAIALTVLGRAERALGLCELEASIVPHAMVAEAPA